VTEINTRAELLAALREDAQRLPALAAAIAEPDLNRGVYEHGWSARQLLAHLAAIEWTYPRLIEQAGAAADTAGSGGGGFDMDAYNHRQVANRAEATLDELLEEFARNRQTTIAAVNAVEDALLNRPTRSAGGAGGTLLKVLANVAVEHVRGHLSDLESAALQPEASG